MPDTCDENLGSPGDDFIRSAAPDGAIEGPTNPDQFTVTNDGGETLQADVILRRK
jgi:hypothetical protein